MTKRDWDEMTEEEKQKEREKILARPSCKEGESKKEISYGD